MAEVNACIEEMLSLAARPKHAARVAEMRATFEARTGAFSPSDAFFEARSAAFWDDALTRGAFGREVAADLSAAARDLVEPLARAHRGLFLVSASSEKFLLVDAWSGAELECTPVTAGLRDALERASGFVDGRVVGVASSRSIALLAGALFHSADALEPTRVLIPLARARNLGTHEFLDALLRMDHALRSLSRVKAAFAYRKEALPLGH